MEKKNNKAFKRFKFLFGLLVFVFAVLYLAKETGYYEKRNRTDSILTKDAILEFEKDVSEGKAVDIKDYIVIHDNDYVNKYSKLGLSISNMVDTLLNDGVGYVIRVLKALFS